MPEKKADDPTMADYFGYWFDRRYGMAHAHDDRTRTQKQTSRAGRKKKRVRQRTSRRTNRR